MGLPFHAKAFDTSWYAGGQVAYSDNIRLDNTEKNETPVSAIAGINIVEDTSFISFQLDGDLQYIDYTRGTFSDELLAAVNLDLLIRPISERLDWYVTNNYGQILEDTLSVPSPSNREDVNFFSTGPDLKFRIGSTDRLTLYGRYSDAYYEERPFDNQRFNYGVSYSRALQGSRSVGLYVVQYMVDYDNALLTDYDRTDAFLRFESETSKSRLRVDGGWSKVDPDDASDDDSGLLAEIDFTREITGNSSITAFYGYNYSDSGERFRDLSDEEQELGGEDVILVDDPFQLQQFSLGYERTTNIDRFRIAVGFDDEDYTDSNDEDRQVGRFDIGYTRDLAPSISVGIDGDYARRDYQTIDREDKDWSIGVFGIYQLNQNIDFRLEVRARERDSTGEDIFDPGYDENRVFLEVRYATGTFRR
jgi:hypothetical protein